MPSGLARGNQVSRSSAITRVEGHRTIREKKAREVQRTMSWNYKSRSHDVHGVARRIVKRHWILELSDYSSGPKDSSCPHHQDKEGRGHVLSALRVTCCGKGDAFFLVMGSSHSRPLSDNVKILIIGICTDLNSAIVSELKEKATGQQAIGFLSMKVSILSTK